MAQYTENYHLSKPEPTDTQSSFISEYCDNMDIIDEHLGQGGGGGSDVSWNQLQVTGDKIATIRISGIDTDVYSPNARTFSMAISRANINSGEDYSTIFGKIKKYFADLKTVAFTANASDLTNDAGFITNTVNNLANYYLKSETYTQAEVNALIGAITTIHFEVVQTLPTSDIQTNVIYLVPKSTAGTNDIYDEYINMDGTSAGWELIGSTQVDLSNYYTKTQTDSLLDGKVSDVKVNDTSVVNSSHVAEITSYEEVTIAQYNALPASKKNCGIAYFIKDLDNASVEGYPPLIYSLEEREVGVWINGKPLYAKSFDIGTLPNSTTKNIEHHISNIGDIVDIYGTAQSDGNTQRIPIPFIHSNASNNVRIDATSIYLRIHTQSNYDQYYGWATLLYTKTTDTAGSGIWNGQGGLAHHYSTSETVVGTWIDGKPIYECVFDFGSNIVISNGSLTNTSINASTMKVLIGAKGIYSTGITVYNLMANINNNIIRLQADRHDNGASVRYVILQYTKTTD